jgi:hypothetical protein
MNRYETYGKPLVNNGYDITPLNGKVPIIKAWQTRPEQSQDYGKFDGKNIGVLCGGTHHVIALDIDVKHKPATDEIRRLVEDLGNAPERIGNAPKTLFVFRCTVQVSKVKTGVYDIEGEDACVEILAEGQQFVASGMHPDTKKKYSWPNDSIRDYPADELTEITTDEIRDFIASADAILSNFGELKARSITTDVQRKAPQNTGFQFAENEQTTDIGRLTAAVAYLPNNDIHYDDWVHTAHAIKGAVGDEGKDLFHRWSSRSSKYDATETDRLWDSIENVTSIGAGTIYHMAQQHGFDTAPDQPTVTEAAEKEAIQSTDLVATPVGLLDPSKMPRREFLYGTHLIQKYVSATIAQGGGSKTTVLLTDAIAMVTGRTLIGNTPKKAIKVWHYNLEDPKDELERRVAAICIHYNIPFSDIRGKLFLNSARDRPLIIAEKINGIIIATPDVDAVIAEIRKNKITAMSVDPFVKSHHADENDNKQIDEVLNQYGRIANETGCSVELAHHVRKPATGVQQVNGDINQARGASAISGAVRAARTISIMSDKEAEALGIVSDKKNWYIRIDDAKGNMSPPADKAMWLQRESVILDNGDAFEQGDNVGIVSPWTPPDAFDGISVDRAAKILKEIEVGTEGGDVRFSKNKGKRWAGKVVVDNVLEMDDDRAKIIIKIWLKTGVLFEDDYRNENTRHDEKGLFVDYDKLPKTEVI